MSELGTVATEKGSILAAAMALIAIGTQRLSAGDYTLGALLIAVGLFCLFGREYLKLHHWHLGTTAWRGKNVGG